MPTIERGSSEIEATLALIGRANGLAVAVTLLTQSDTYLAGTQSVRCRW